MGIADCAFVDRKMPRGVSDAGVVFGLPPLPDVVQTKTTLLSKGLTIMRPIDRPLKTLFALLSSRNGPLRLGVPELAPRMMYMPTPAKLSADKFGSPVPTYTMLLSVGSMVIAPMASDSSWNSKSFVQLVPPFVDLYRPPCAVPTYTVFGSVG